MAGSTRANRRTLKVSGTPLLRSVPVICFGRRKQESIHETQAVLGFMGYATMAKYDLFHTK